MRCDVCGSTDFVTVVGPAHKFFKNRKRCARFFSHGTRAVRMSVPPVCAAPIEIGSSSEMERPPIVYCDKDPHHPTENHRARWTYIGRDQITWRAT